MASMMGSLRWIALVVVLAPTLAAAQPSGKDRQQASDLVKKAIAKSQAGEHDIAVQLYLDAYKIIPQPLLLSNVGSEYQQMEKPVEALKYFCKYIEADPTGNNVGYAVAQARTLYIELGGQPSADDAELCKPIVKPEPVNEPAPPPVTPPEAMPAPTPAHGSSSHTSPLRYAGVAVAIVGAGAFGVGTYYGLQAKKISDEITNHKPSDPWPANIKNREAEGKSDEKKQIGFMIGGGVALAAGVTMFFLGAPKTTTEASISVAPIATADTLGFAAAGRF